MWMTFASSWIWQINKTQEYWRIRTWFEVDWLIIIHMFAKKSMMTFVLQRLFIVVQHLSILFSCHSIQTLLVVIVWSYCPIICDVFEYSVQHRLCCYKSHEVFNWSVWSNWHVKSVEPQWLIGCLDICLVFNSFLLCLNRAFLFGLFSWIPEISIHWSESNKESRTSKLNNEKDTGPSLLTALARC